MHRRWLTLLLLLLCLVIAPAQAEEEAPGPDWMPPEAAAAMEAQWPGMRVLSASGTWPEVTSLLALVDTGTSKLACILALADGRWQIQAVNDAIIDDGAWAPEAFWIGFGSEDKSNFIWYSPKDRPQDERYITFDRGLDPAADWAVMAGHFGPAGGYPELGFHNRDGVMWVKGEYAAASILPHQLDMRFDAYDPQAVRLFTEWAYDMMDSFLQMIPSTGQSDALPQGQHTDRFAKGKTWPVYSGPGKDYARLGEGKAAVSTNGWIQVFGREKGWLFIQYNISPGRNRFGWIEGKALPAGVSVPELRFTNEPAVLSDWLTDDPLRSSAERMIPGEVEATVLATMGEDWRYVEAMIEGRRMRGFAGALSVIPRSAYEGTATVRAVQTPLIDEQGAVIGRYFGGARLPVLGREGDRVWVRIGEKQDGLSGWLAAADVAMDAAPKDVAHRPAGVLMCPPDGVQERLYAAPDMARSLMGLGGMNFRLLGEVQGYAHVEGGYAPDEWQGFFPLSWVMQLPENALRYQSHQRLMLTRDCPVLLRPDADVASRLTLYRGVSVEGVDLGNGWFFTRDWDMLYDGGNRDGSYGYLPMACLQMPDAAQALPVGQVRPAMQRGVMYAFDSRTGSQLGLCSWGQRVVLVGETEQYLLVRTPQGQYGYLPHEAVTPVGETCPQDDPARLCWGSAQLVFPDGEHTRQPYDAPYPNWRSNFGRERQAGEMVRLLADLGGWWHVVDDRQESFFVPEGWLSQTVPAPRYEGMYGQLRDLNYLMSYQAAPPLVFNGDEAYALLGTLDAPALAYYVRQGDDWQKQSEISQLLGPGLRWLDDLRWEDSMLSMEAYLEGSDLRLRPAFAQRDGRWRLAGLTMSEDTLGDAAAQQLVQTVTPQADGFSLAEDNLVRDYRALLPPDDLAHFVLADWARAISQAVAGEKLP